MVRHAIIGKVIEVLSSKERTSKKGDKLVWRDYLIEESEENKLKITTCNLNIPIGTHVCVPYELVGTQYNSTYFNNVQILGVFVPFKESSNNKEINNSIKQSMGDDINQLPF